MIAIVVSPGTPGGAAEDADCRLHVICNVTAHHNMLYYSML